MWGFGKLSSLWQYNTEMTESNQNQNQQDSQSQRGRRGRGRPNRSSALLLPTSLAYKPKPQQLKLISGSTLKFSRGKPSVDTRTPEVIDDEIHDLAATVLKGAVCVAADTREQKISKMVSNLTTMIRGPGGDGYVQTLEKITANKELKKKFDGLFICKLTKFENLWKVAAQEECQQYERYVPNDIVVQIWKFVIDFKFIKTTQDDRMSAVYNALSYHGEYQMGLYFQGKRNGLSQRINLTKSLLPVLPEDKQVDDAKQEE